MKRTHFSPRRSALRRRTELKRSSPPRRKKRINGRNRRRAKWKFRRNFHSKEFVKWTKRHPCMTCGARTSIQVSHVKPRGIGGCGGSWKDTIPQCRTCHRAFEAAPKTWPAHHGHDMPALARLHHARWIEHTQSREGSALTRGTHVHDVAA